MIEELNWGCAGMGTALMANGLGAGPVLAAGSDAQKRQWLPPLVEEPILCSFALTEPNAGSDVSGIETTATRHGDEYVLNGSKMFITNAGHAEWYTLFASTDRSQGHRGLTAFVVPREVGGRRDREASGQDGPALDRHLGPWLSKDVQGAGARIVWAKRDRASRSPCRPSTGRAPATAIAAVGVARAAFEYASEYSKTRVQFGQPIARTRGVNF